MNDDQAEEALWQAAQEYHETAVKNFYLDELLDTYLVDQSGTKEKLPSIHLDSGELREYASIVHFLFPNLSEDERELLEGLLSWRNHLLFLFEGPPTDEKEYAESREQFLDFLSRYKKSQICTEITAVQIGILDKYFLPEPS